MKSQLLVTAAAAWLFSQGVVGQTFTDCDPLNTTCAGDVALGKTVVIDFTQGESTYFTAETGTTITYDAELGATFTIDDTGVAKTIVSNEYIFFGKVEFAMRSANGTGIISSFVMESDDLDEIDLEWMGGNNTVVETNYFGKDNTTSYNRATYVTVETPNDSWHMYAVDWTRESVRWYVDGELIRTLLYADALNGHNFPQTPMMIKFGNWDGGAADEATGTVEWAQGETDLSTAPFIMYVKNVTIQDYTTNGTMYTYGDQTGDWTSIVVSNETVNATGTSTSTATETGAVTTGDAASSSGTASASTESGAARVGAASFALVAGVVAAYFL